MNLTIIITLISYLENNYNGFNKLRKTDFYLYY